MAYSQSGYSNFQSRIEGYGNTAYDGQDDSFQGRASAAGSRLASEVGATVSAIQDGSMYSSIREQAGEAASILSQAASGVAEWFRPSTSSNGYSTPGNAYVDNNVPSYTTPAAPPTYTGYGNNASGPGYNAQPPRRPWGNAAPTTAPTRFNSPPPPVPPVQPVPEASSTARGVSGALPKGKYEAQLVKQVTAPGGTRVKPSDAVLREFYRKVRNLDLEVVGNELAKALDEPSASWQHRLRVLYVVDGLWAQGLEEPVTAVKEQCANTGLAELAADTHTRVKAVPILKEWGMDVDDLASAPTESRTEVEAAATRDLLDLAEPTKTGHSGLQQRGSGQSAILPVDFLSAASCPAPSNMPWNHLLHDGPFNSTAFAFLPGGINVDTVKDSHGNDVSPYSPEGSAQLGKMAAGMFKAPGSPSPEDLTKASYNQQLAVKETEKAGQIGPGCEEDYSAPCPRGWALLSNDSVRPVCIPPSDYHGHCNKPQPWPTYSENRKLEDAVGCEVKYPCKGEAYKVKEFPQQETPPMLLNLLQLEGDFM
ncbi:hypothetical protein FOZ62_011761 [Perkinsus olseni]|uniref:CPW-WPC domain-containing protein n=1 Tax=Perkinsus olseni TaxID=32597 RepID=A0A7J6RHD6_PEROL|nr:hypothetical protein FOZ62_011761 [Perkinsus olseni]